jgi:DNA ligase (NAD+)
LVVFTKGKITGIYTRGDGAVGGDVGYLRDYITFPDVTYDYFVVRGEFMLPKSIWEEKYKGTYANARSFVSAKINTGYVSPALTDIQFIAYSIIDWSEKGYPRPSKAFKILREQGFSVADNGVFEKGKDLLVFDVVARYKELREKSAYGIDGLVLTVDVPSTTLSKAFKMTLEEQLRRSKITDVDWGITRYGRYFPVAVFESVYVDGVRLHRASAHNASHIVDWSMGRGTRIVVTRSGDVIPVIKDVTIDDKIRPILPDDDYKWYWTPNGKDIVLEEIEENPRVQVKRISHFFTTIQAPQIGEGRIRKLHESGMTTLSDIVAASAKDIQKIKGFGPKLAKTVHDSVHDTMRKTRLDRYYEAITTYRSSIGRKTLRTAIRYYPGILTATEEEIIAHLSKKGNKIPGIGPAKTIGLAKGVPEFRRVLMELCEEDVKYALQYQEEQLDRLAKDGYNPEIKGKTFVTTGFLNKPDYDLEDYIWDHWGETVATVTSDVSGVIAANVANITGKMMRAYELGVPVYTVEEFISHYNIPFRSESLTELTIAEDTDISA